MSNNSNLFCAVKAGTNTCGICYNEAYYSIKPKRKSHDTLPDMELFRCGHGVCECCLEKITARKSFKCPFCRAGSAKIANFDYVVSVSLEARGLLGPHEKIPAPVKQINTFSEFMEEWENAHLSTLNMNHQFVSLHKQIIHTERERVRVAKSQSLKEKAIAAKAHEKKRRASSRNDAVCPKCHKKTFNSMKQLEVHMIAKHPK